MDWFINHKYQSRLKPAPAEGHTLVGETTPTKNIHLRG